MQENVAAYDIIRSAILCLFSGGRPFTVDEGSLETRSHVKHLREQNDQLRDR